MRVIMSGRLVVVAAAVAFVLAISSPASAVIPVTAPDSTGGWLGFMNVFELDQTTYVFGSPWGTDDLVSDFDDANGILTLSPNTIADPNEFWYQGGRPGEDPADPNDNGGPGAMGNKYMDANLFIENLDGTYANDTVEFTYTVLSNTLTSAHTATAFIRDFEPGFSSPLEATMPLTVGTHTVSLLTAPPLSGDPADIRPVQFGFNVKGENVWSTDVAPFGSVEIMIPSSGGPTPIPGDANGDDVVDLLDLDILGTNFGLTPADFSDGDFNDDDVVDLLDLDILGTNFGTGVGSATAAAVPEPSTIALLGMACATLAVRKRS